MFLLFSLFFTLLFGFTLILSYYFNPARLINGVLSVIFIILIIITASIAITTFNYKWLTNIYLLFLILGIIIIIFLYYFQGLIWLWNAWIVWHRESHSLTNNLTLVIGILTILLPILNNTLVINGFIKVFINLMLLYILFCITSFTSIILLFNLIKPKANKRFIIILGSGLLNGNQVSPLLASRINKAIKFFYKIEKYSNFKPLLICSGGKGLDENISEGEAMRNYIIMHGVNSKYVISENRSKNTLQNMIFSKKIIQQNHLPTNSGIYVSNNYHIFRAGMYARKAGLKIQGLGAKTSLFFVPNAIIREYIALFTNHKILHITITIFILIFSYIIAN